MTEMGRWSAKKVEMARARWGGQHGGGGWGVWDRSLPSSLMCLVLGTLGSGGAADTSLVFLFLFSPGVLDSPAAGTAGRAAKSREPSSALDGLDDEYLRWWPLSLGL